MARMPTESDTLYLPADVEYRPLPSDVHLSRPRFFPPPTATTPEGLVCVGGRLAPEWLLDAYSHAIFPWPMWEDEPIAWWSPNPRAVFELDGLHVSRRLQRTLRSGKFLVTCDKDFHGVIHGCATGIGREGGTWITPAMIAAYGRMHELGHAHSIEVWLPPAQGKATTLVGGTYGLAIGGLFAAESMFYRSRDASKVALAHLVAHLRARGYQLFDIQQLTPHTASLGATEISRIDYLRRLANAIDAPITFGEQLAAVP
jgi:leucyl/phenylalanyl-tRNA--protein transferase